MHILSDRTLLISLSDEFVEALAAAKVPDPFKELLNKRIEYEKHEKDQTDEAAAREPLKRRRRRMLWLSFTHPCMDRRMMSMLFLYHVFQC